MRRIFLIAHPSRRASARYRGTEQACVADTRKYRCDSEDEQFRGRIRAARSLLFLFRFHLANRNQNRRSMARFTLFVGLFSAALDRKTGIEPATHSLWAVALPLSYFREGSCQRPPAYGTRAGPHQPGIQNPDIWRSWLYLLLQYAIDNAGCQLSATNN